MTGPSSYPLSYKLKLAARSRAPWVPCPSYLSGELPLFSGNCGVRLDSVEGKKNVVKRSLGKGLLVVFDVGAAII